MIHQRRRDIAELAARAGAAVIRARAGSVGPARVKGAATDLVTEVDIASGVAIVSAILEHDPGARVVVEEPEVYGILGIERPQIDERPMWLVDPIDGTTSFLHGFPCYSVAIAYVEDLQPVAGAVYNLALDEMLSAARDLGATKDGETITCGVARLLTESLLVTGFPYDRGAPLDRQMAVLTAFLRAPVHGIRRDGSAAIDCCHVAIGRADGFWEFGLQPWDMAAGVLICREAGAVASGLNGSAWNVLTGDLCVANPVLHPLMLDVIRREGGA